MTRRPASLTLPDGSPASAAWTLSEGALHLNHGSFGAVPCAAQEHQQALRAAMEADPVAWFATLGQRVGSVRREVARIVGAAAEHLALVPNASAGASVVYACLSAAPGAEVVVTDHGYGAVTMGAERAARRWGGRVRVARVPLSASTEEVHAAVFDACTPATRLIVLDQVTSATARLMPVAAVAATARARDLTTLVDGAHSLGLYHHPVAGLGCDVWVGNLHKWACAPRGTAALVAPGELRHELYPLIDSWGAPEPFPVRFDTQGTVDVTSYLAAPTSYDFVAETWGWDVVRRFMSDLADYAEELVAEALTSVTGDDHRVDVGMPVNAMRLVRLPAGLATTTAEADTLRNRLVQELGVEAAFTSFDGVGYYRLSAHAYNTADDFEEFAERVVPLLCDWALRSRRDGVRLPASTTG